MDTEMSSLAHESLFNNPSRNSDSNSIRENDEDSIMDDNLSSQYPLVDFGDDSSLGGFDQSMSPNDAGVQGLGSSTPGSGYNTAAGCHQGVGMDGLQHQVQSHIPVNPNQRNNHIGDTQGPGTDSVMEYPGNHWNGFDWIPDAGSGLDAEVDGTASIPLGMGDLSTYADTAALTVPEVTTSGPTPTDTHGHALRNMHETTTGIYSRHIPYQDTHHEDQQCLAQQENDGTGEPSVEAGDPTNEGNDQSIDRDESPHEEAEHPAEEKDHRHEGEQAVEDEYFSQGEEDPVPEDDDGLFAVPEPHNHDLRPGFRDGVLVFSTWLDQDASGNYDPHSKTRKRTTRKRQSAGNADSAEDRRLSKTQKRLFEAASRVNGSSYVMSFKFSSERGKALLEAGTNNWPDDEWNVIADPLQTAPISATSDENDDDDDDILDPALYHKGYKLRSRRAARVGTSINRPNLQGQPMARGCWGCYETGLLGNKDVLNKEHGCSLAHDGTDWPCSHCAEDDQECELITPPKVKKSCERCKKRKVNCSYTRTSDHSGPCSECQEVGQHCVAGPNKSVIPHRISLDDPTAPPERDVSCTECLKTNKKCTLESELRNNTGRGCRSCEKKGSSCIVADQETPNYPLASEVERRKAAAPQKRRKANEASLDDNHKSRMPPPAKRVKLPCPPRPPPTTRQPPTTHQPLAIRQPPTIRQTPTTRQIPTTHQPVPTTKTITTKFCHPIEFCSQSHCNFCEMPSYRVLGLGPMTPTVTDEPKSTFTELRNGHSAGGQATTKVCATCTFDLAKILQCGRHELWPIPPHMATGGEDFEAAFERLISGDLVERDHWCQLCPAMAEFACGKKSDGFGDEAGCGLKLCWQCADALKMKHDCEMDRFMDDVPNEESSTRPFGLRADAELLRPDGQLGRFLERMAD